MNAVYACQLIKSHLAGKRPPALEVHLEGLARFVLEAHHRRAVEHALFPCVCVYIREIE